MSPGSPHAGARAADEAQLRKAVERVAGAWPTYGYRRVTAMLRRDGWAVNGKRVRRVMRELGLEPRAFAQTLLRYYEPELYRLLFEADDGRAAAQA